MEVPSDMASAPELREQLGVVWRHKWIVTLSIVIITTAATAATIFFSTPKYKSSTELLQRRSGLEKALIGSDIFQQTSYQPEREMQTAAELVVSPEVEAAVSNELGDRLAGRRPSSMINVSVVNKADILRITATDADPQLAADVSNSFARNYINWRLQVDHDVLQQARAPIEAQIQATPADQQESTSYRVLKEKLETLKLIETMQTGNLEIVKPAVPAATPVSPKPLQTGVIAFLVSIIFGIGSVFLVERLDNRIRKSEEITKRINKPILASVPKIPSGNGALVTISNPSGACSESFRILKTNLSYAQPDNDIKSIMITSPEPGEGKSTTIANLAVTMARAGQRVIVLEGDLRRPVLSQYMGLDDSVGVSSVIAGNCSLREALQLIEAREFSVQNNNDASVSNSSGYLKSTNGIKPIYCATAGPLPPNPGELVASEKMGAIIKEASKYADVVLVDAPPFGVVGDATSIASKVDGVVFVVKLDQTEKKSLDLIKSFMETIPSNVLGIVITNAGDSRAYGSGYSYYQYKSYH